VLLEDPQSVKVLVRDGVVTLRGRLREPELIPAANGRRAALAAVVEQPNRHLRGRRRDEARGMRGKEGRPMTRLHDASARSGRAGTACGWVAMRPRERSRDVRGVALARRGALA